MRQFVVILYFLSLKTKENTYLHYTMAPKKKWLEDNFPFWNGPFSPATVGVSSPAMELQLWLEGVFPPF